MDDTGQVIADEVELDGIFEPGRERGHGLVRVVPRAAAIAQSQTRHGQIAHLRDYANLLAVEEATGSPVL